MKMTKSVFPAAAATALLAAGVAQAQINNVGSASVNSVIPQDDPVGMTSTISFSGVAGVVTGVTLTLDISGGFNGDLYASLTGPSGSMTVLLNRVGMSGTDEFGYSDTGFNVTFADGAPNIHSYQLDTPVFDGDGALTGTWAPDGRTVDPGSPGSAYDTAAPGPDLSVFNGSAADGAWTLFVADMSGGTSATLVSWGLTVVTVPEPQTWLLLAGGVGVLFALNRRRKL